MPLELRCPGKKQAALLVPAAGGVVEVKCDSRICKGERGVVVLHEFSTEDGSLIATHRYKNPPERK